MTGAFTGMRCLVAAVRVLAVLGVVSTPVAAHEFWISPQEYSVAPGGALVADLRVGEDFGGASYSYLPRNIQRFDIGMGRRVSKVTGRAGDRPALNMPARKEGLAVVIHQTTPVRLTYNEAGKFDKFVTHKGMPQLVQEHKARGLPETGFTELYSRFAKSLIAVGDGAGQDRNYGLEIELVALANPYTDDLSNGMPVELRYQGKPRSNAQIELFEKRPGGQVRITLHQTDGRGRAVLPMRQGAEYLVDSVVIRPLAAKGGGRDPVWESVWASLTFRAGR